MGARYHDVVHGPPAAWPPPSPHPDMDLWQQAGLNLLHDVSHWGGGHDYSGVPTAQAAGVSFMIMGPSDWTPDNFQKDVRFFADDPRWNRLCGVELTNEAGGAPLQEFREERDWLLETYPHLLTLVCESLTGNKAGRFLWEKDIEVIQPDAFLYQFAPYHTMDGGLPDFSPGVYACLGRASEYCKARGIGFFIEREAYDWGDSVRRLNTFASLVYGARGFIDWYWDSGHNPSSSNPTRGYVWYDYKKREEGYVWSDYSNKREGEGTPTNLFQIMAQINREVNSLGPALINLRHMRTYHLDLESGGTWAGPIYNFDEPDELRTGNLRAVEATTDCPDILGTGKWQADRSTDHLMVGFFRDDADEEYFMVVNKNNTGDPDLPLSIFFRSTDPQELLQVENITLTFAPEVSGIQRLNRLTGEVEELSLKDHSFSFSLPGGTGDLFKYASDAPFAGTSQ